MRTSSSKNATGNSALRFANLKTGLDALEERARSDLGMIASHETFYQVDAAHGPGLPDRLHGQLLRADVSRSGPDPTHPVLSRSQCRYWLVMPAAGVGRRFGQHQPKQYAPRCKGLTVIEWALAAVF